MPCPTGELVIESKDPRINYNLLPGEELMTCPYDKNHAILPFKFANHVFKCYNRHCREQAKKGQSPLFMICRYDRSHHVLKEKLAYHESTCDQRKLDDDWDDIVPDASGAVGGATSIPAPPEIDEASLQALRSNEDWEAGPMGPAFDRNQRIHQSRLTGYNVINTLDVIGLSKSEKQAFYKTEKLAMDVYAKIAEVNAPKSRFS